MGMTPSAPTRITLPQSGSLAYPGELQLPGRCRSASVIQKFDRLDHWAVLRGKYMRPAKAPPLTANTSPRSRLRMMPETVPSARRLLVS
jgi:hypothetical protein